MLRQSPFGVRIEAAERLTEGTERLAEAVRQVYKAYGDYFELLSTGYRHIQDIINAYSVLTDNVVALTRTLTEGVNTISRLVDSFLSLGKAVLTSNDALAAAGNIFTTLSSAIQEVSQGFGILNNLYENITKVLMSPLEMLDKVVTAFERFQNQISYFSHEISSLTERFSSFFKIIAEVNLNLTQTITPLTRLAATFHIVFEHLGAAVSVATSLLQIELQRVIIPIQQVMLQLTRFSMLLQQAFIPLRMFLPVLQTMINLLGTAVGFYGRLVLAANEFLGIFSQLQGTVISLHVYLLRTGEDIKVLSNRLVDYGVSIASTFEYVKASITAGLVPLTSMVNQLASLSRHFAILMGLTPDEVFRRLSQAIIEGNVAILQQIGILMTEADILNIIATRFGLLVTNLRQIPPLIRQQIMTTILQQEARGVRTGEGTPLLYVVSELRAIIQNFGYFIGNILRTYTLREDVVERLTEGIKRFFGSDVASSLAQAFGQILQTIMLTLTPILDQLRSIITSTAFSNLVTLVRGVIVGLGAGVERVIRSLGEWLRRADPQRITNIAVEIGARISAFIQTLFVAIQKLFPIVFNYVRALFEFIFNNIGKIFEIFALASNLLVNAAKALYDFITTLPGKFFGAIIGAVLAGIAGFLILPGIGTVIGALIGGLLGWWGGGKFIEWWQRRFGQRKDVEDDYERLRRRINELEQELKKIAPSLKDMNKEIMSVIEGLRTQFDTLYQKEKQILDERLNATLEMSTALRGVYQNLIQAVQPIYEHFRNLTDTLKEFFSVITSVTSVFGELRIGDMYIEMGTFFSRSIGLLSAAWNEVIVATRVYTSALAAAADNARGVVTDVFNALRQVATALRRFYEVVTFIGEQLNRLVGSLVNINITALRIHAALGMLSPQQFLTYLSQVTRGLVPTVGQRLGEFIRMVISLTTFLQRGDINLLQTIAALETLERLYTYIQQTLSAISRTLETIGALLLAHTEFLREQVSLFTALHMEGASFSAAMERVVGISKVLEDYFRSLGNRIAAAFTAGNIEEFLRLSRQLLSELRTFYMERLPQFAGEIAEFLMSPINMWMRGIGELRNVLQQLGAEGLTFPLMLRNAIPELVRMINYFALLRDEMFRHGLIPAAIEFNNRLLQVQRTILEILGLGGMFLPAYTPEQIIRARELLGTLPLNVLVDLLRGRYPYYAPTLRVVPPAALWQLLAFAPGIQGLFGPFISPGQLLQLLPLSGLFSGLWEGFRALWQMTPEEIRRLRREFIEKWALGAMTEMNTLIPELQKAIEEGLLKPLESGREILPRRLLEENIRLGRIAIREFQVDVIRAKQLTVENIGLPPAPVILPPEETKGKSSGETRGQPPEKARSKPPEKKPSTTRTPPSPKSQPSKRTRPPTYQHASYPGFLLDGGEELVNGYMEDVAYTILNGYIPSQDTLEAPYIPADYPFPYERALYVPVGYPLRYKWLEDVRKRYFQQQEQQQKPPIEQPPKPQPKPQQPSKPQERQTTPQKKAPTLPVPVLPSPLEEGVGEGTIPRSVVEEMERRRKELEEAFKLRVPEGVAELLRRGISPSEFIFEEFTLGRREGVGTIILPLVGITRPPVTEETETTPPQEVRKETPRRLILQVPTGERLPPPVPLLPKEIGRPLEETLRELGPLEVRRLRIPPRFALRPSLPTVYPVPLPYMRPMFPVRPFPTTILTPLPRTFGFGVFERAFGGFPPIVLYPYTWLEGEGEVTVPSVVPLYTPSIMGRGPFLLPTPNIGTISIRFETREVRLPLTLEVSVNIRDKETGNVIETITKEISTVVHLNPKMLRE